LSIGRRGHYQSQETSLACKGDNLGEMETLGYCGRIKVLYLHTGNRYTKRGNINEALGKEWGEEMISRIIVYD